MVVTAAQVGSVKPMSLRTLYKLVVVGVGVVLVNRKAMLSHDGCATAVLTDGWQAGGTHLQCAAITHSRDLGRHRVPIERSRNPERRQEPAVSVLSPPRPAHRTVHQWADGAGTGSPSAAGTAGEEEQDRPWARLAQNRFWLLVPVLVLDFALVGRLPPPLAPGSPGPDIAGWLSVSETVLRVMVFGAPRLMPLSLRAPRTRPVLAVYSVALTAYVAAWVAVVWAPTSAWSTRP